MQSGAPRAPEPLQSGGRTRGGGALSAQRPWGGRGPASPAHVAPLPGDRGVPRCLGLSGTTSKCPPSLTGAVSLILHPRSCPRHRKSAPGKRPAVQSPAAHHLLAIHAPETPPQPWPTPLSFTLCVHGRRASPRNPLQGDGKACSGQLAFLGSGPCCAHAPQRWGWGAPHLDGRAAGNCQGSSPVPGASPRARCLQSERVAVRLTWVCCIDCPGGSSS